MLKFNGEPKMAKPINRDKKPTTPEIEIEVIDNDESVLTETSPMEATPESSSTEITAEIIVDGDAIKPLTTPERTMTPELLVEPVLTKAAVPAKPVIAAETLTVKAQETVLLTSTKNVENRTLLRETEESVAKTKHKPYTGWWR